MKPEHARVEDWVPQRYIGHTKRRKLNRTRK